VLLVNLSTGRQSSGVLLKHGFMVVGQE